MSIAPDTENCQQCSSIPSQENLPLMTPFGAGNDVCFYDAGTRQNRNPNACTGDANTQAAAVAIYQIGCFLGAILILLYGEVWGRKSSTFWGSLIMIIGTIMQAACFEYGLFVAGRIVGGIGNGMVTSSESSASLLSANLANTVSSDSYLAVRMRSSSHAWYFDHSFRSSDLWRYHDCVLVRRSTKPAGILQMLTPRQGLTTGSTS